MSDWTPGEGWREVTYGDWAPPHIVYTDEDGRVHYLVREKEFKKTSTLARLGQVDVVRRETAKAVLDFLASAQTPGHIDAHSLVAARHEFGVES